MKISDSVLRKKTRASLHRQIVDELGKHIIRHLSPGDTLPNEEQLCARFDVSRTVVREATKVLAEKGLIESRPKVGTMVQLRKYWNLLDADVLRWEYEAGPSREFLLKISEVRLTIEGAASELAAQRATPEQIAHIEVCYDALVASVNDNDEYITADIRFHESIFAASQNEFIEQIAMTLRLGLISSRRITVQVPGGSLASLPLHRAVLDAIRQRNPAAARAATDTLISRAMGDIELILKHTQGNPHETG